MNWYKQYKIAMPLPNVVNDYPRIEDRNPGITNLDDKLTFEHSQELSEDGMGYLGAGLFGTAFQFNDKNIVKKFTTDTDELKNAKEIVSRQNGDQPLPGFVYVYEVKDLSRDVFDYKKRSGNFNYDYNWEENKLFQITTEKVQPLSENEHVLFNLIYYSCLNQIKSNKTNEEIIKYGQEQTSNESFTKEDIYFLNMAIDFLKLTEKNKYLRMDLHPGNVGIRDNKEMVVLDLGAIDFQ